MAFSFKKRCIITQKPSTPATSTLNYLTTGAHCKRQAAWRVNNLQHTNFSFPSLVLTSRLCALRLISPRTIHYQAELSAERLLFVLQ